VTTSNPVRVLWLIRGLGPGGAEHLLVAHARVGSAHFRYDVAYQVAAKDQLVGELEAEGATVHRLDTSPTWPLELRRLVADREIDVVHAHSPIMAVGARLALRALPGGRRPALVYTEHNRWGAYRRSTRWANAATFWLDHRTFAVSDEARRSVAGVLRGRVETLHHGIDAQRVRAMAGDRSATRHRIGITDTEPLVVNVANFRVEKAHDVLLAALATLRDQGRPVHALLVGHGQRFDAIADLVTELHLGDQVQMLGFRDDVAALLGAADALVLSSDHEGLPVAIMESLALGIPVVATAVGGVPEAITDECEGLLVAPRDPDALADAIARVAFDRALRARLSAAAALRSASFDAAVAVRRIEDAYRGLASAR